MLVYLLVAVGIRHFTTCLPSCLDAQHTKGILALSPVQTSPEKEEEVEMVFSLDLSLDRAEFALVWVTGSLSASPLVLL